MIMVVVVVMFIGSMIVRMSTMSLFGLTSILGMRVRMSIRMTMVLDGSSARSSTRS
jgi:hypothetical protein